jgi:crotonobetainyl-CoA:carnitine CoA-transferase CaiB-like acyl-CoA transferase
MWVKPDGAGRIRAVGLLDGITVLDLTRVLAGPYCTRLLADLGARVVKIERPNQGDETRRGHLQLEDGRTDQSTYFIRINAGKLSLALDLAHAQAAPVVRDLARSADVVVENFVPGVVARLGCDYATLAAIKPDLVYCSISGFGQTGPLRERPAFAHIVNTVSGLMDLERQGEAAPRVAYLQASDVLAGTHAFGAIVAALLRRARTGEGAYLDVSMLECLIAAEDAGFAALLNGGEPYTGPRPGMIVHHVHDGWVALQSVGAPDLWARLLRVMKRPDLADDPRFATPAQRRQHWPELRALITEWLDGFASAEDALAALTGARLPCSRMLSPTEVASHPHLAAREFFPDVGHPTRGKVRVTATPFHVDGRALTPAGPAPYRVGEHSRAVLSDMLGYPQDRIAGLIGEGVVGAP